MYINSLHSKREGYPLTYFYTRNFTPYLNNPQLKFFSLIINELEKSLCKNLEIKKTRRRIAHRIDKKSTIY